MIDPDAETFLVQRQRDGTLLIQRLAIERLQVHFGGQVRSWPGLDAAFIGQPTFTLTGRLAGGGEVVPEGEVFTPAPREIES